MKSIVFSKILRCTVALTLLALATCFAEGTEVGVQETNDCNIACDVGQNIVSFVDGNKLSCMCSADSDVVPTVPDPTIIDSGEYVDEGRRE